MDFFNGALEGGGGLNHVGCQIQEMIMSRVSVTTGPDRRCKKKRGFACHMLTAGGCEQFLQGRPSHATFGVLCTFSVQWVLAMTISINVNNINTLQVDNS